LNFSQDTAFLASQQSTGLCVFLHLALLRTSNLLLQTHCRHTPRAQESRSGSESLPTCARQRTTDSIYRRPPSLLGTESKPLVGEWKQLRSVQFFIYLYADSAATNKTGFNTNMFNMRKLRYLHFNGWAKHGFEWIVVVVSCVRTFCFRLG
jgi:hypothetical protein